MSSQVVEVVGGMRIRRRMVHHNLITQQYHGGNSDERGGGLHHCSSALSHVPGFAGYQRLPRVHLRSLDCFIMFPWVNFRKCSSAQY